MGDGEVHGESRWRHLRGRVRQGGQEDLHLLLHFRRQRQEGERHRKLRQKVQWGSQEHVTEQRRLLVHLWIQCQEGQGQDGQGYRCWGLYWRYWRRLRLWNAWRIRIRDARRFRNARRRIQPLRMRLRPHAQRHGDRRRLRNAPDATNRNWIRIGHASHWWQRNRLQRKRLHHRAQPKIPGRL